MNLDGRRIRMVMELRRLGVTDPRVLGAMERCPREDFLSSAWIDQAYDDRPLPIGHEQTISQPSIVGHMLQALDIHSNHRVLEIGVGSGYQTALLSSLCRAVYGIERIKILLDNAEKRLSDLGVRNAFLRWSDGGLGWPEAAPYDRIIAAATADDLPGALADQLKPGGIIVLPIKEAGGDQNIWRVSRHENGFRTESVCKAPFVPLLSGVVSSEYREGA
ncbi:MAG: protein-L-isoaspartate(D-aspartate) O-methyltransferase [Alphaproteobacteria bacterium]